MNPVMTGPLLWRRVTSPLGELLVIGRRGVLTGLLVASHDRCPEPPPQWIRDDGAFDEVRRQLEEYFAGGRTHFELPIDPPGTAFQHRVWAALLEVPFGETTTYGKLARQIGSPRAARAVGAANGSNPISLVIPCHRVIGADGSLTGYGGGIERKAWLLQHERTCRGAGS